MVHALKPNPKSHIQEGWRIMDFFSHHPESMHMVAALACTGLAALPGPRSWLKPGALAALALQPAGAQGPCCAAGAPV